MAPTKLFLTAIVAAVLAIGNCTKCENPEITSKSFTTQDATIVVSWTEDIKSARSGDRQIRVFDEEGYTALRKAIRSDEDVSTVPALFNVILSHPGSYSGPWLKSELVATILSLVVAYFAIASRSKVLS